MSNEKNKLRVYWKMDVVELVSESEYLWCRSIGIVTLSDVERYIFMMKHGHRRGLFVYGCEETMVELERLFGEYLLELRVYRL
jgi:hypothetical protein